MTLTEQQRRRFRETGFLILRGLLSERETRRYFTELDALLRATFGAPYDGRTAHWVPATDRYTPFAAGLLADERFRSIATELLGRAVLGEGTDGSFYVGDTRWHHDAVHPELFEAVKFTLYGDPIDGESGALRLLPGSHRDPLHTELQNRAGELVRRICDSAHVTRQSVDESDLANRPKFFGARPIGRRRNSPANHGLGTLARGAGAWPQVVFDSRPGDAVVFDVRLWHGAFNGGCRIAGSVNYRIDPDTEQELTACRRYFARSHRHVSERYGGALTLYPEYFRSLPDPHHRAWVRRLRELGVDGPLMDAPAPTGPRGGER